ncbi:Galactose binding lectin domain containing protein 1-like protein, partial [Dinothrombium tinctorium]
QIHYKITYACEGNPLHLHCEDGRHIHLVRANYGRFSISICNDGGRLDWSVNCMSYRSFLIMQDRCSQKSNCSVVVSSKLFGDPCPGTLKYLEVQYHCAHSRSSTTTKRPPTLQINIPPVLPPNDNHNNMVFFPAVEPTNIGFNEDMMPFNGVNEGQTLKNDALAKSGAKSTVSSTSASATSSTEAYSSSASEEENKSGEHNVLKVVELSNNSVKWNSDTKSSSMPPEADVAGAETMINPPSSEMPPPSSSSTVPPQTELLEPHPTLDLQVFSNDYEWIKLIAVIVCVATVLCLAFVFLVRVHNSGESRKQVFLKTDLETIPAPAANGNPPMITFGSGTSLTPSSHHQTWSLSLEKNSSSTTPDHRYTTAQEREDLLSSTKGTTGPILVNPVKDSTLDETLSDINNAALKSRDLADYECNMQQIRNYSLQLVPTTRRNAMHRDNMFPAFLATSPKLIHTANT